MFEEAQIQEFKEAFTCIDQNRDGIITEEDLKDTCVLLNQQAPQKTNVSDEELGEMLKEGKGPMNLFLTLFGQKLNARTSEWGGAAGTLGTPGQILRPPGWGQEPIPCSAGPSSRRFRRLLLAQAQKFSLGQIATCLPPPPTWTSSPKVPLCLPKVTPPRRDPSQPPRGVCGPPAGGAAVGNDTINVLGDTDYKSLCYIVTHRNKED
ncbi:myosin regulatory light chain 2, atrial isoform [Athene noctua]|uniref:myosin regulatory light chain 2, atrial isoform n=1 Tax=Athene noctua TaxID=126797 RepID=UPI003EBF3F20